MRRRQFLAASAFPLLSTVAGCLRNPEPLTAERVGDEPGDTAVRFVDDAGENVASLSVGHPDAYGPARGPIRFAPSVWHREDTHLDRLRYEVRAPPTGAEPYVDVTLKTPPGGPWPEVRYGLADDGRTTVFEADELGLIGAGTVTLEFALEPNRRPPELPVRLGVEYDFSTERATRPGYRVRYGTVVVLQRARPQQG
jgi:hypothetical protein